MTLAAKAATTTTPIIFAVAEDPVRLGLVASLARPGGNVTGLSLALVELAGKTVESFPGNPASRDAVLVPWCTRPIRSIEPFSGRPNRQRGGWVSRSCPPFCVAQRNSMLCWAPSRESG